MKSWRKSGALVGCWVAVFALCIWGGGRSGWFLLYMLSGLIIYVASARIGTLRMVQTSRQLDRGRYIAGEEVRVSVTMRVRSWLPFAWLSIQEPWLRNGDPYVIHRKIYTTGFTRTLRYEYTLEALPRGVYQSEQPTIMAGDLFGIMTKAVMIPSTLCCTIIPHPELVVNRSEAVYPHDEGRLAARDLSFIVPDRIKGVRDYAPGDPLNRIHWKASAKGTGMKTVENETVMDRDVMLMLDTHHSSPAALEKAISVCAGMMKELQAQRIAFGYADSLTNGFLPQERMSLDQGMDSLAAVGTVRSPEASEAGFEQLLWSYGVQLKAHTEIVSIVSRIDEHTVRTLHRLRSRNKRVHLIWVEHVKLPFRERQWLKELQSFGCSLSIVPVTEREPSSRQEVSAHGLPYRSLSL